MLTQIKFLTTAFLTKVSDYLDENATRRFIIGSSLSGASVVYMFVFIDMSVTNHPRGVIMAMIAAAIFVLGLLVMTRSLDALQRGFSKFMIELVGLASALAGVQIINEYIKVPLSQLGGIKPLLLFVSLIAVTLYFNRIGVFVFSLVQKVTEIAIDKVKKIRGEGEKVKSRTELFDGILKNLVSIAGTLAVLYRFVEPVIKMIIGK